MKMIVLVCGLLFLKGSVAQNVMELPKFQSIESRTVASIQIVKSEEYRMEISNHKKQKEFLDWQVLDDKLKLTENKQYKDLDFKEVLITIHLPSIKELIVTKRTNISMDSKFSTINTLSVIAENGANVDLSNISFNTLIIYKDSKSDIKYKSVNTLINNKKPYKH